MPFAPPTIADCCAKLFRSLPIKALPSQCLSNQCRALCLTNQCQALAQPCPATQFNALTSQCNSFLRPGRAGLCRSASLPRPCGSSPSRSGLYRHGSVQFTAALCLRNSYPRNSLSSQVQPYQCSAVAPADHCVTMRARPSQCRSDHLMTPAFRLTSGHNPCSVIPCKTAHPQSLRISRPRSHLSSPSRPLPWLISSASCCTLAPLFNVPLFNAIPSAMPSHAISIHAIASRFAAVRISAFQRSLAALLCASRPLHCATPHSIAPHHPLPYQAHQSPALHLLSWA